MFPSSGIASATIDKKASELMKLDAKLRSSGVTSRETAEEAVILTD